MDKQPVMAVLGGSTGPALAVEELLIVLVSRSGHRLLLEWEVLQEWPGLPAALSYLKAMQQTIEVLPLDEALDHSFITLRWMAREFTYLQMVRVA